MTLSLNFSKLKPFLTDDTLVLTPNARTQQAIYAGQIKETELEQVISPCEILTFPQWQNELWTELSFIQPTPNLVSKTALILWMESIISEETEWNLTNVSGVANKVVEAYQNLLAWKLSINDILEHIGIQSIDDESSINTNQSSPEVDYFIKWIEKYNEKAKIKGMICSIEMLDYIFKNIELLHQRIATHKLNSRH